MSTPTDITDNTGNTSEGEANMTVATTGKAEILADFDMGLPANKRCDSCGAQAWVEVEMPPITWDEPYIDPIDGEVLTPVNTTRTADMLFCGHHYARNEAKLRETAKRIFDYRALLTRRPSNINGT